MKIIISNSSGKPIYEQISDQIRGMIVNGELEPGYMLPSMRSLAQDLRISLITTKRAYNDLESEGYIETVAGKGCFVAAQDMQMVRESMVRSIEEDLQRAVDNAKRWDVSKEELFDIIAILYEGDR